MPYPLVARGRVRLYAHLGHIVVSSGTDFNPKSDYMLEREHIVAHYMPSQAAYSAHVAVLPARCAGADLSRAVHGTFLRI